MSKEDRVLSTLSEVPELVSIAGSCVKGTGPHPLTELETEYVVNLYKYACPNHIIVRVSKTSYILAIFNVFLSYLFTGLILSFSSKS